MIKNTLNVSWKSNGRTMNQYGTNVEYVNGKIKIETVYNPHSPGHDVGYIFLDPEKVAEITIKSCDPVINPGI